MSWLLWDVELTRIVYSVAFVLGVFCSSSAMSQPRYALVVGNSSYASNPLKNPIHDARDVSSLLKTLDFEVITLKNAKKKHLRRALHEFSAQLASGGVGLFFYAGHGVQVDGENYLIPIDADIRDETDVPDEAISVNSILRKMDYAANGLNIVILDACRDNPYARKFRSSSRGLARIEGPTGSVIAYATSPGQVALDGTGNNGVYTKHLLQQLSVPSQPIEVLLRNVRVEVLKETNGLQEPWELSSLTSEFIINHSEVRHTRRALEALVRQIELLQSKTRVDLSDVEKMKNLFLDMETVDANNGFLKQQDKVVASLYIRMIKQKVENFDSAFDHIDDIQQYFYALQYLDSTNPILTQRDKMIGEIFLHRAQKLHSQGDMQQALDILQVAEHQVRYSKIQHYVDEIEEDLPSGKAITVKSMKPAVEHTPVLIQF